MSTNFWELLQQHQNDLTKSGHMVADYLVQHAAEAQYLSISSLARECKVAEATVFRFCSMPALEKLAAAYRKESNDFENFDVQKDGLSSDCIYEVFESSIQK